MLNNRIRQLEAEVVAKEKEIDGLRNAGSKPPKSTSIPSHLSSVQKRHLPLLRGFRMLYKAKANGACAQGATAVHIHENEDESEEVKKRINNHIADNWDTYYESIIGLPYVETVGVGETSKTVTKTTKEEMLEFLRGKESLLVYSNTHELQATANLYNINISVFTYGGNKDGWTEIIPDPKMVAVTM